MLSQWSISRLVSSLRSYLDPLWASPEIRYRVLLYDLSEPRLLVQVPHRPFEALPGNPMFRMAP